MVVHKEGCMKKLKIGKKSGLKYFGYKDIKSWVPCYDPSKYISKDFRGTAIDILKLDAASFGYRLWCVLRPEIISEKVMRLFAVWSYRQTLNFIDHPDPRSIAAANAAEAFALGKITSEELLLAEEAAKTAAWAAARAAAAWAARAAASAVARSAREAAESASEAAARAAARAASEAACILTWSEAWAAAEVSAESAQRDKLIEMIIAEGKERRSLK